MSLEIKFCPTCNNILNITKNPPKNKQNIQIIQNLQIENTPETVSDSNNEGEPIGIEDDEITKIQQIIEKLSKNENVDDNELVDFKLEQFLKHKSYQKLEKKIKQNVNLKLTSFYEKIEDATNAYYFCAICSYFKPIEAGTLVASRMSTNGANVYMNMDKLKNRVNNGMLPYTRNYICTNDKCVSHKDHSKREAVMFRIGTSVQMWYTCCACQNSWKGE